MDLGEFPDFIISDMSVFLLTCIWIYKWSDTAEETWLPAAALAVVVWKRTQVHWGKKGKSVNGPSWYDLRKQQQTTTTVKAEGNLQPL